MKYPLIILVGILILTLVLPGINAEVTYTPTTSTICNNGVCTQTIYSGTQFVYEDNVWKDYTEARSLKDKGFEVNVLEDDKDYPLEVVDFNATSITVKLNPKGLSVFSNEVPIRIWDVNQTKEEQFSKDVLLGKIISKGVEDYKSTMDKVLDEKLDFNLLNQEETKTYSFGIGKILEFGINSTTITLDYTDVTDDSYVFEYAADTNYGESVYLNLEPDASYRQHIYIRFNITGIPVGASIINSTLSLKVKAETLGAGQTVTGSAYHIYNNCSWSESTITWNNKPTCYESTAESSNVIPDGSANNVYNWTVVNSLIKDLNLLSKNFSMTIQATAGATSDDHVSLYSSENGQGVILYVEYISPQANITYPINNIKYISVDSFNWTFINASNILSSCWYSIDNGINNTLTCLNNYTTFSGLNIGNHNINFRMNDTAGVEYNTSVNFIVSGFEENSISYNSTSYETQTDNYILNVSSDGSQPVAAILYYNGTAYISTKTGDNTEMLFTNTITHPINNIGNKSFYWNVSYGGSETKTATSYQNIINTTLNLCNGTNGMVYINFTFKDEATDGYINSTFEIDGSGWQYYLGSDSSVYKTLNYNQQTNKSNYAFCLYNSNQTIHSNSVTFRYDLPGYPERLHTRSSDLTNTTTNVILYLLSTSDGIYSSFQVQDTNGAPISDVSVQLERQINGVWTVIGLDETDNSGLVTFFVNPNQDHRITFSKTGYTSQILIIRPTQSLYTVVLSGGITEPIYSPDYLGINYKIAPNPGVVLTPGTVYGFTFNITANLSNLVSYSFNLYDEDNNLLDSDNGITTEGSNLTIYLNTSTYESIIGKYYINIGNETQQITLRTWTVLQINAGNYSISTWFTNLDMSDVDVKGKFTGYFIFFLILFVGVAGLTKLTGMELASPGIALGLVLAIAWIASLGGFFNITFSPSDFINKYGVVLVITMMCAGFTLGQLRKT